MMPRIARGGRSVRLLTFILTAPLLIFVLNPAPILAGEPPGSPPPPAPISGGSVEVIAPIAEINIKGWKIDRYNGYLVDVGDRMLSQIYTALAATPFDASDEEIDTGLDRVAAALEQARQEALALPPWKGDASLRDAVAIGAQESAALLDRYRAEALPLLQKQEPVYADLLALESLTRALDARAEQIDLGVRAAQRRFAERNNLLLLDTAHPEPPPRPEFQTPGLPPPGSALTASTHISLVVRHHNALAARVARAEATTRPIMQEYARNRDAESASGNKRLRADLPDTAAALAGIAREIEQIGPWGDDRALYDAALSYARSLQRIATDLLPAQIDLQGESGVPRRERATFAAREEEIQKILSNGPLLWKAAAADLFDRYSVRAYEAWFNAQRAPCNTGVPMRPARLDRPAVAALLPACLLLAACAARAPSYAGFKTPAGTNSGATSGATSGEACPRKSMFEPVTLPPAAYQARIGAQTARFSELATTRDLPVEVCMVQGQLTWLTRVRCDDGSNPFPSMQAAHAARRGNVGAAGRCGSIIDLYAVPCPEKTYEVYMDLYVCPA